MTSQIWIVFYTRAKQTQGNTRKNNHNHIDILLLNFIALVTKLNVYQQVLIHETRQKERHQSPLYKEFD